MEDSCCKLGILEFFNSGLRKEPSLFLMKVFLMVTVRKNEDMEKLKFRLEFLIQLSRNSQVWFASMVTC